MADVTIAVSEDVAAALGRIGNPATLRILPAFLPPSRDELALIDPELLQWIERDAAAAPLVTMVAYRVLPPVFGGTDVYGIRNTVTLAERLSRNGVPFKLLVLLAMSPHTEEERALLREATGRLESAMGRRFRLVVGAQAAAALARSRVMIRPTTADGDSVAVREALALGAVVIATDAAPRPSGTIVVPTGDSEGLYSRVVTALRAPAERAARIPSSDSCLKELERIYRGLASRAMEPDPSAKARKGAQP
jgi:hypothetical protein